MNRVRQAVLRETGNRQQPWDESSLTLDFYFVPPLAQRPPVAAVGPGPRDDRVEVAFWESVHDGGDPRLFEEYLRQYPDGRFAALARLKLDGLRGGSAPALATAGGAAARTEGVPGPAVPPPARPPPVVTSSPPTVVRPGAPGPTALPNWGTRPGGARFESVPLGF